MTSNFVVGFDIGCNSSYIVIGQANGLESIANGHGDRNTPTCISFNAKMRFIGSEAKQYQNTNIHNTVTNFPKLLGKTFNDPIVQKELAELPYNLISISNNRVGIEVAFLGEAHTFTPEQLFAMQLSKLKQIAEKHLNRTVTDVVVNLPCGATTSERQAVLEACQIARLRLVSLVSDTTATALSYGIYNRDGPPSKLVAFVDMGYAHLQTSLVRFTLNGGTIIASACEPIGGCDFDSVIMKKCKQEIWKSYKLRVVDASKPGLRLRQECEKLKKQLSATSAVLPLSIDCFMNDVDVVCKLDRAEFEKLSVDIVAKIGDTLRSLLRDVKLTANDIDAVEIVGGSCRVPMVKQVISEVFGKDVRTSLNADESVARGCALLAAVLAGAGSTEGYRIEDKSVMNGKGVHNLVGRLECEVDQFREVEERISKTVADENEKIAVKNSVEEFIYQSREAVESKVSNEEEKRNLLVTLSDAEEWLYEDGENMSIQELNNKLDALKELTKNIF